VYAPAATIQVSGNGSVFGALTGNMVTFNGSGHGGLHYDEALGRLGETTSTRYSRYSWREIAF
jgi:hypothetical protein